MVLFAAAGCAPEASRSAADSTQGVATSTRRIKAVLRWGGDAEGGAPFVEADPGHPDSVRGFD
ncbi:MAG: hypothetical protein ABIT38_18010, partial [Gemmatimonadaceae bacterium]